MICLVCGNDHEGQREEFEQGDTVIAINDFWGGIDNSRYDPFEHTQDTAPRVLIAEGSKGEVVGHCDDGRALTVWEAEKGKSPASHSFHYPHGYLMTVEKLTRLSKAMEVAK
jgi:hypothetical protein